jgi:ketosteroid isomerase-like protein
MPQPPSVDIFTRYVLENPWPLGIGLLLVAAWLAWSGFREGLKSRQQYAAVFGLFGIAVLVIGHYVVTSGEHAKALTRSLVDAVVSHDSVGALSMFTNDAVFTVGSPNNPGYGIDMIRDLLDRVAPRYPIESNTITMLRGYPEDSDLATVHLACLSTVSGYPSVSQWVLQVRRQHDGSWKITRLTCVSINDRPPPLGGM